jgi:heterodisulfide reductase subunit B
MSFKAIAEKLGIVLREVRDWICCGTSPAHSSSRLLALTLPIINLCQVEKMRYKEVVVPCAACFSRFKVSLYETSEHPEILNEIKKITRMEFKRETKVLHPLEILQSEYFQNQLKKLATKNLSSFKIVCYYGCLLTRPAKIMQFDICEYPMSMDRLLNLMGIQTLDWSYKTDCCGGAFSLTETDVVLKLTNEILENARDVGANGISVACPLCHANLDTRQTEVEAKYNTKYEMPIFYFTQLIGLAIGLPPERLGLNKHLVNTQNLVGTVK